MKKTLAVTALALTSLFTGNAALADQGSSAKKPQTTDDCVMAHINEFARELYQPKTPITITFNGDMLEGLVQHCEGQTDSKAKFFKGLKKFEIKITP